MTRNVMLTVRLFFPFSYVEKICPCKIKHLVIYMLWGIAWWTKVLFVFLSVLRALVDNCKTSKERLVRLKLNVSTSSINHVKKKWLHGPGSSLASVSRRYICLFICTWKMIKGNKDTFIRNKFCRQDNTAAGQHPCELLVIIFRENLHFFFSR